MSIEAYVKHSSHVKVATASLIGTAIEWSFCTEPQRP